MAKGISIPIASDTREFASGIRDGVIDPLNDVDDELKKLGRGSNIDELERDMKGAQKATSEFDREIDKARENLRRAQRESRSFGDETKDSFHDAGHYSGEFKDEALANFSEVASSFDGSMTSIVDLAQGTFGGLASLGGPVGIALGGLAALIGGAFTGISTSADENAQKAEERISKMYDAFLESGQNYLTKEQVGQAIRDITDDTDQWKQAQDDAKATGIDLSLILRAQAGDAAALASVQGTLADKYAAAKAEADEFTTVRGPQAQAANAEKLAMEGLVQRYGDYTSGTSQAAQKAEATRKAFADLGLQADGTTKEVSELAGAVKSVPSSKTIDVKVQAADAQEKLRQLGKAITVDMFVTPRTGRGIN